MDGRDDIRAAFERAEDVDLPDGMAPIPDAMPEDGAGEGPPPDRPASPDDGPPPEAQGAEYPLNDTGNGKRLALYCGGDLMVVPRVGWHVWDGRRWAFDPDAIETRRHAQGVQDRILREIPFLRLKDSERLAIEREEELKARIRRLEAGEEIPEEEERGATLKKARAELARTKDMLWGRGSTRARHLTFGKSAGNSGAIKNMLTEGTVPLSRRIEQLDSDPLSINTETGLLRFTVHHDADQGLSRTAEHRLHDHARAVQDDPEGKAPPQLITKLMPVAYDSKATCENFDAFLARVQPDPQMRAFLQRWLGLSLTGLRIQKFAFFYGSGANGKSVLTDLIARMLGDYAHSAKVESFTGQNRRGGGDATPDIFPLMGSRMVRASEPEEGQKLQEGMIKELTGGEPILVRQLHADFIEVHPFFKLTISGNHKPEIRGTDDGIWRRVLLVPFDQTIPPEERDEKLGEKLWEERSGILNWLIEGLIDYLERGLREPDTVLAATEEYRADSDPVGQFLDTVCQITGDYDDNVFSAELGKAYNYWALKNGLNAWKPNTIGRKLRERSQNQRGPNGESFSVIKSGTMKLVGIRMARDFQREFDDAPRDARGQPVPRDRDRSDDPI